VNDWQYFFVPQYSPIPEGLGFGIFSPTHLAVLAGLMLATAALIACYRRSDSAARGRIRVTVGVLAFALEAVRQVAYLAQGLYTPDVLPLHMCAVTTFFVFIDALHSTQWTRQFLYAMGSWGALCALLFPDWASRPLLNIYTWQSFLIHACLFAYALMRVVAGEIVPEVRQLWRVAVILAVVVPVSLLLNGQLGTNFWFLATAAPGSPLEPIQTFAGGYYIPFLLFLVVCVWALLYLPWELARRKSSSGNHPNPSS
jgi:hypothetical integral membrane protein (TIGR02206 family)